MEHPVKKVFLDYGDARITFYIVDLFFPPCGVPYLHSHCYYEFHFLAGNAFTCCLKDRDVELKAHEFIIVPPDFLHCTTKSKLPAEKLYTISLTIDKIGGTEKFYDTIISALHAHVLKPLSFPRRLEDSLFILCQKENYKHIQGVFQLKAAAADFVAWIFQQLLTETVPLQAAAGNNMVLIDNMINGADITLEEMAEATNYSKRHISRLIMQRYGCNLSELRRQRKIQKMPEENKKKAYK